MVRTLCLFLLQLWRGRSKQQQQKITLDVVIIVVNNIKS